MASYNGNQIMLLTPKGSRKESRKREIKLAHESSVCLLCAGKVGLFDCYFFFRWNLGCFICMEGTRPRVVQSGFFEVQKNLGEVWFPAIFGIRGDCGSALLKFFWNYADWTKV